MNSNSDIKSILKKEKLGALLISSPANIKYLTSYSGFSQIERECFLLITRNIKYLITDGRYSEVIKKRVEKFEVIDCGVNAFLKSDVKELLEKLGIKNVGFEEDDLSVKEYFSLKKLIKLKPVYLNNLRVIKTSQEIKNIKLACKIGDQAFEFVCGKLRVGISEEQIANTLEQFMKQKGAKFSFEPIIAFGKNSSVPHHQSSSAKLKKNQIVLLDFGVSVDNYCSDMTRTVFFGSVSKEYKQIYETVLEAQQKAISAIKLGVPASKIDKIARDYIISKGYPNIIHSVGHGIGVGVHEAPHVSQSSKDLIKEGMVFSVEPGIYIEGWGGVRIEDIVVATKSGSELISHANRNIIEI